MSTLAQERAASLARQRARDEQHQADKSPWMLYVEWLFGLYPNNPVSLLCFEHTSAPGTKTVYRREAMTGSDGGRAVAFATVKDQLTESPSEYDHRIGLLSAPDEIERFYHRLPEEHTFEAWLATQED